MGGVVSGVIGVLLIGAFIWWCCMRGRDLRNNNATPIDMTDANQPTVVNNDGYVRDLFPQSPPGQDPRFSTMSGTYAPP